MKHSKRANHPSVKRKPPLRWRLLAANGRAIARSGKAYSSRAKAVRAARKIAPTSHVAILVVDDTQQHKAAQ